MKLLMVGLYRFLGSEQSPILVDHAVDLSSFSFFTRGTIGEHLRFACRTVAQRTAEGTRQTVGLDNIPFVVHAYVRHDGLSGVVVSDQEYPQRVAFSLMNKMMMDFESTAANSNWKSATTDSASSSTSLTSDLTKFQNPAEADKLTKVQRELDDIKEIMHKNIEDVMKRGETLDTLMEKSNDLTSTSVTFYKQAKKQNQCCQYY